RRAERAGEVTLEAVVAPLEETTNARGEPDERGHRTEGVLVLAARDRVDAGVGADRIAAEGPRGAALFGRVAQLTAQREAVRAPAGRQGTRVALVVVVRDDEPRHGPAVVAVAGEAITGRAPLETPDRSGRGPREPRRPVAA